MVPVPAGGQDAQLEQIREMQVRLDEGAGTLEQFRWNIGQEWADQAPAGEARHLPQGIQHRIANDVRARPPPGVIETHSIHLILLVTGSLRLLFLCRSAQPNHEEAYHSCPHHAISWGAFTKGKGQYWMKGIEQGD